MVQIVNSVRRGMRSGNLPRRHAEGVCDLCVSVADYWLQTSLTRSLILSVPVLAQYPIRRSEICEACLIRAGRRNALRLQVLKYYYQRVYH